MTTPKDKPTYEELRSKLAAALLKVRRLEKENKELVAEAENMYRLLNGG